MPFCYGSGANGKSVFLNTLLAILGDDYAMKAPHDLLMAKRGNSHPTERASLFGKRMVAAIETDEGRRLAEGLVKELTGGDSITARRMYEDNWQFWPTHKIWMCANHKPIVRGNDYGIWRRIKLIPFVVTIPPKRQDKDLPAKLLAERSGILRWCVDGCVTWRRYGLAEPHSVTKATAEYRDDEDVIGKWLEDCCAVGETLESQATALYESYCGWCDKANERPKNQTAFGREMTARGFGPDKKSGVSIRNGLSLLSKNERS